MKQMLVRMALVAMLVSSTVAQLQAAQNKPVELSADTIEYDSTSGLMIAKGNVNVQQDNAVMTGQTAEYNSKTQEVHVTGGVRVVKENATLVAADIRSYNNHQLTATGNPVLTKGDSVLTGPTIDYDSEKQYAIVKGWAKLTMPDSQMTANQIESYFAEQQAVAKGNVHIISQPRHLDAIADQATYYSKQGSQGKTVLTGNVKAVQDGNTLTGNVMTLYLDNKTIDVQGRSKLIIIPQ